MSVYYSGFSASVESFVNSRKISGAWNETVFGMNIRLFDRYCAEHYPGEALRQEMVDIWCARRKTENVNSCYTRMLVIRLFIGYLRKRGQTDVLAPPALKQNKERRIPHAFSHEELERFFRECDQIIPCRGRLSHASELRKITCPVFFRLLYSSGIRTTEARFLTRSGVDFAQGVLDIQKSKGYDQHYVALHPSMTELLERYDRAADRLNPEGHTFLNRREGILTHAHGYPITFPCCGKKQTVKRAALSLMISGIIMPPQISTAGKMMCLNLMTGSIIWQGQWGTAAWNPRCIIILSFRGLRA